MRLDGPRRDVFDVQNSRFGGISPTDVAHNTAVVQAAMTAASNAGGGTVYFSPSANGYPLKPGVTAGVTIPSNVTLLGCGYPGRVILNSADAPHTTTVGAQTLTGTGSSLTVASTTGFASSGTFLIRGSTEDSVANGSFTSLTASTLEGAKLTGATTSVGAQTLPLATLTVVTTSGFPAAGTINFGGQIVTYTGKTTATIDTTTGLTTGTFTGCTGGTGTIADGAAVTADSVALPDASGLGQVMQLFQNADQTLGNDNIALLAMYFLGPGRLGSTVLNDLTCKAVRFTTNTSNTTGPTGWCNRPRIERCTFDNWPGPQIHAFNVLDFHFDRNTFVEGWRGGIIGGNDSHRGTINGNVFRNNHDDCINWQGRGQAGGVTVGATYPTRVTISGNLIQEADWSTETAQLNNGITVKGVQFFTIAGNTVEGSDEVSSISAGISVRNIGVTDTKHGVIGVNTIVNTGSAGIVFTPGDLIASGGNLEDVLVEGNEIYGARTSAILFAMRNNGAQMTDVTVRGGQIRDCGAVAGQSAAIRVQTSNGVVGPLVTGLTIDSVTVSGAGEYAFQTDSVTSFKALTVRGLRVRNPNRLGSASIDAFRVDASASGAALNDFEISDNRINVTATTSVGSQTLPVATFNVTDTLGFPATGSFVTGAQTVTYTGKTATSFTGCTGGSGTIAAGTVVAQTSVRFGITVLAAGNATDGVLRRNRMVGSQFTNGAYSITAGGTRVSVDQLNPGVVVALTDAATVAVDATLGDYLTLSTNASRTMGAPTGMQTGWQLTFDVLNNGGSGGIGTWNAAYKLAGAWTNPANGKRRTVTFRYDGTSWVEVTRAAADI